MVLFPDCLDRAMFGRRAAKTHPISEGTGRAAND